MPQWSLAFRSKARVFPGLAAMVASPAWTQIVAAINDAGVEKGGGTGGLRSAGCIPLHRTLDWGR